MNINNMSDPICVNDVGFSAVSAISAVKEHVMFLKGNFTE
jgi:hypothetical protein